MQEQSFIVVNNKTNSKREVIGTIAPYTGKQADIPLYGDNDKPRRKANIIMLKTGQRALLTTTDIFEHNLIGRYVKGTIIKFNKARFGEKEKKFTDKSKDKSIYNRNKFNLPFQVQTLSYIEGREGRQVWSLVGHEIVIPLDQIKKII